MVWAGVFRLTDSLSPSPRIKLATCRVGKLRGLRKVVPLARWPEVVPDFRLRDPVTIIQ
jgi:hypothetical protein